MKVALAIAMGAFTLIWVVLRVVDTITDLATIPAMLDDCRKHFLVPLAWVVAIGGFIMALYAQDDLHSVWLTVLFAVLSCAGAVTAIFLPDTIAVRFRNRRTR